MPRRFHLFLGLLLGLAACRRERAASLGEIIEARSQGLLYLDANQLPEAERAFKRLISLAPEDAGGHAALGLVYLRMGRPRSAEPELRAAIARDSTGLDGYLLLASALAMEGRRDDARQVLLPQARGDRPDPKVLYALVELSGNGPDSSRDRSAQVAELERLSARVPGNQVARLELAQALSSLRNADGALRELEALRQVPPALPADAVPPLDSAIQALRRGDAAQADRSLAQVRRYLELTLPFQAELAALRGPQISVAGLPSIGLPFPEAMRERLARGPGDPTVTFRDVTSRFTGSGNPGSIDSGGTVLAVADYDGDGVEEILTSAGERSRATLLRWQGGIWSDGAAGAGIEAVGVVAAGFGDFDNDGYLDLYLGLADGTGRLYRNDGKGHFRDQTRAAGLGRPGVIARVLWADLDHDGDLDLLLATSRGLRFFRNNGDGVFREVTREAGFTTGQVIGDVAFGDFDEDGLLDVIGSGPEGPAVWRNGRERRFADRTEESGLGGAAGGALAVADYNNDGHLDLFLGGALFLGSGTGRFVRDDRSAAALPGSADLVPRAAVFFDYDNDGLLDLAVAGTTPSGSPRLLLLHNEGGRFRDRSSFLPPGLPEVRALAARDIDQDRDLDLLATGPAGLRVLQNDGGNANLAVRLTLKGLTTGSGKNNVFGIGATIEARVGERYLLRLVTDQAVWIGLGPHLKADVIRVNWPNGVPQTVYFPGRDEDVLENQVLKSSCAFLYAWTGTRFDFVTDVMWRSALGMPIGIGGAGGGDTYAPPGASREYLRIPDGGLGEDRGRYRLRLTEELWETSYTDQVELVAVDHPDSVAVVVDERFVPPGPPVRLDLYQLRRIRPPVSAVDGKGTDLLPALLAADDRYAANLDPDRYQGLVEPHELILDLGNDLGSGQVLLLLRGWVFPTDASINVALSQGKAAAAAAQWPVLDVKDGAGAWRTAITDLSIPSGKNKLIVADLTGKFPSRDHRVRVRTNLQIYWDQVSVATAAPASPVVVTSVKPIAAELRYRGFSRMYRKGGRSGPHWFDYQEVSRDPAWRPIAGEFTRYGDVTTLLQAADDRYLIMAPGDETTLEFDAGAAPPLPRGWRRDFFFYSVGWIKDADFNTAEGGSVAPLPFHGMTRYPYGANERYPDDPVHRRYRETFNTRRMPGFSRW